MNTMEQRIERVGRMMLATPDEARRYQREGR